MFEIKEIIKFIGIDEGYINDTDILDIMNKTSFDAPRKPGYGMHKRSGRHCNFWNEIANDTILWMNELMLDTLPNDVTNKINESCVVSV